MAHLIIVLQHWPGRSCGVNPVEFPSLISMFVVPAVASLDQVHHHPHQDGDQAGHGKQGSYTKSPTCILFLFSSSLEQGDVKQTIKENLTMFLFHAV